MYSSQPPWQARLTWNDGWHGQNARVPPLVVEDVILVQGLRGETDLVVVDAAPRQELTVVGAGQRVMRPAGDVDNVVLR